MASHTSPDYDHMDGSRIALGYGIDNQSNTGGESGGEVVNSGATVSPRVNSVPVQRPRTVSEAYHHAKDTMHPWFRGARTISHYALGGLILSFITAFILPIVAMPLLAISLMGCMTVLVMYVISPIVTLLWENPYK